MDRGVYNSFRGPQVVFVQSFYTFQAREKGSLVCIFGSHRLCCYLVLGRNKDGIQKPVYYVSKSLQEAELRYLPLEKAVLAIVHATRKLPHYFQAHTIVVLT